MEDILSAVIVEMLSTAKKIFAKHGVDYFIVGAIARDIHLAKIPGIHSARRTNDVDFALMVPDVHKFEQVKAGLVETGDFTADAGIAIKLWYRQGIEIDLMPFGAIENSNREISLQHPKLFTMDVPGFMEAHATLENVNIGNENFFACTVEGLILLKLYAWNDRPERNKDLQDIDLLIARYLDISSAGYEKYFDVLELYDEKQQAYLLSVGGRIAGRALAALLSHNVEKINKLKAIILKRPVTGWVEMAAGLDDRQ